jgi:citrate synthase
MPATREQVRRPKIIDHTVDFGDGVMITFSFDANKMTDEWMDEWTRHEEESNVPQLNAMLADLIERWDILEHEGGPTIPVSAEEIGKLFALPVKLRLMREFLGLPSDAEGNASTNTSSTPSSTSSSMQESLPNGLSASTSVPPSASQLQT